MKRYTASLFVVIGFIIATTCAAHAQTARRIVVNVPFDFIVGKQTMPAGEYSVRQLLQHNDGLLLVQSADRRTTSIVQTNTVEARAAAETGRLEFQRRGASYYLFRVWTTGAKAGRELPARKAARSTLIESAKQDDTRPQTISIAGRMK